MKYRGGYKYQTLDAVEIHTTVKDMFSANVFCTLDLNGLLRINPGYAWDGPSGLFTVHTDNFMTPSLVHDALYQMIREELIPADPCRLLADKLLKKMCIERGMSALRAQYVYAAVRNFGSASAIPGDTRPVLETS